MDAQPRRPVATLTDRSIIVTDPGVYAFYREGERAYVANTKASCATERRRQSTEPPPNRRRKSCSRERSGPGVGE